MPGKVCMQAEEGLLRNLDLLFFTHEALGSVTLIQKQLCFALYVVYLKLIWCEFKICTLCQDTQNLKVLIHKLEYLCSCTVYFFKSQCLSIWQTQISFSRQGICFLNLDFHVGSFLKGGRTYKEFHYLQEKLQSFVSSLLFLSLSIYHPCLMTLSSYRICSLFSGSTKVSSASVPLLMLFLT